VIISSISNIPGDWIACRGNFYKQLCEHRIILPLLMEHILPESKNKKPFFGG